MANKGIKEILDDISNERIKTYQKVKKDFISWASEQIEEEFKLEQSLEEIINPAIPPTTTKPNVKFWGKKIFYTLEGIDLNISKKNEKERNWKIYLANARIKSSTSSFEKEIIGYYSGREIRDKIGLSFVIGHKDINEPETIRLWKSESIDNLINLIYETDDLSELKESANNYKAFMIKLNNNIVQQNDISNLLNEIKNGNFNKYKQEILPDSEKIRSLDKEEIQKTLFKDLFFKTYETLKEKRGNKNKEAIDMFIKHLIDTEEVNLLKYAPPKFKYSNYSIEEEINASLQTFTTKNNKYEVLIINSNNRDDSNNRDYFIEHLNKITKTFDLTDTWYHREDYKKFDDIQIKLEQCKGQKCDIFYFYDNRKDNKGQDYGHTIVVKKNDIITLITDKSLDRSSKKLSSEERDLFLDNSYKLLEKILDDEIFNKEKDRSGSWGKSFSHMIDLSNLPDDFEKEPRLNNEQYDEKVNEICDRLNVEKIEFNEAIREYWNETVKKSGYEKVHLFAEINGRHFEIQIGDVYGEWNNKEGSASHKRGMKTDKKRDLKDNPIITKFAEHSVKSKYNNQEDENLSDYHKEKQAKKIENQKKKSKDNIERILSSMTKDFNELKLNFYLGETIKGTNGKRKGGKIQEILNQFNNPENADKYILGIRLASKLYEHIKHYSGEEHANKLINKDELFSFIKNHYNNIILQNNTKEFESGLRCIEAFTSQNFLDKEEVKEFQNYIIKDIMIKSYENQLIDYFSTYKNIKDKKLDEINNNIEETKKEMIRAMSIRSGSTIPESIVNEEYEKMIENLPITFIKNNPQEYQSNLTKSLLFYERMLESKIINNNLTLLQRIEENAKKYSTN